MVRCNKFADLSSTHSNKHSEIYALWGTSKLRDLLKGKKFDNTQAAKRLSKIPASKQVDKHKKIIWDLSKMMEHSQKRQYKGEELFCFYIGRTSNFRKRKHIFKKILTPVSRKEFQKITLISFFTETSWEKRFYAEHYAIATLFPVYNVQPEC